MFKDMLNGEKKSEALPKDAPAEVVPAGERSIEKVKIKVAEFEKALKQLEAQAEAFEVKDDATMKQIVELGTKSAKLVKKLTADRKKRIEKEDAWVNTVNALYRPLTAVGKRIKDLCAKKFATYDHRVKLEEAKRKKLAEEAHAKLQADLDKEADQAGVERVEAAPIVVPETPKVTRVETGSGSIRMRWTWEEQDINLVPREYLMLDASKITKQVNAGVRQIPGIKIFEKPIGAFRT